VTDDFSDIPVFVAVVEAGSFSDAARRLNLTRSAVGKAVSRLEERIGGRLFHRTTRTQSLTEDGQSFHEHCQRALAELRAGQNLMDSGRTEIRGRLRVSMPVLFGRRCVAPILLRLSALHPELEVDMHFSDRLVDLVDDGFDLCVRNGPVGETAGLVSRAIAVERMLVCASPRYLEVHGTPETLADLAAHRAIAYGRHGRIQPWSFLRTAGSPSYITPSARLNLNDIEAISDAVAAGFGLAWLSHWLVRDRLRSGELVEVLPDAGAIVSNISLMWPATPHLPQRVRSAIDALTNEVAAFTVE
jgi:DNA-binding transcriptional LysR family regulator